MPKKTAKKSSKPKFERPSLSLESFDAALESVRNRLVKALKKHGTKSEVSWHEILGDVTEEYTEFVGAVQENNRQSDELHDIAIAAIWGIASDKAGNVQKW